MVKTPVFDTGDIGPIPMKAAVAIEQWLVRHNDKAKESIMVRGNRNITWSDMLSELRNQTDVGKDFERMMNQYYLRVFKDKSEI